MAFFDYMAARAADSHAARTGNAGYSTMKEKAVSGDVRGAQKMAADLALATGAGITLAGLGTLGVGGAALYTAPNTIAGLEAANALGAEAIGAGAVSTASALGSVGLGIQLDNSIQNKGTEPTKTRTTATTATSTQRASNVVSPDPTKGETWVSMYERSNPTLTYDQRTKSLVNGNQRAFVMEQAALGNDALTDGRVLSNTGGGTQYIDRSQYTLGPDNVWRKKKEAAEQKTPYQGLFSGDLRTLDARRNWVGENADYLRAQGWSNEDIEGYKGLNLTNAQRASLNLRLARVLGGANDWYAQQAEAGRRMNEGLTKLETPIIAPAPVKASDVPIKIAGPAVKRVGGKLVNVDCNGNIIK